ncbi:MAG: DUF1854 domain-containing protein [Oscillospiraceae bacterium]|nr:DUF1854 domain-containing protein [Oscillospiraceae bacterium]
MSTVTEEKVAEKEGLTTAFTPAADCRFYRNERGFLGLALGGTDYKRVQLSRALPFSDPGRYLCVADMEGKEVAVLESLEDFEDEQRALLEAELGIRYFYPVVTQVKSIKEKMGSYYLDLAIGEYKKTIAVKDISKNLKQLGNGKIILTDVDGNRFLIPDVYQIQKKSLQMLEPYLY